MNMPISIILDELRDRLQDLYGTHLERLILFGSRARGDADPESDIDVLAVLSDEREIDEKQERVREIICQLCLEYDTVISCVFTTPEKLDHSGMPFYRNVRREGVPI